MPGSGLLTLTGQQGEVMQESVRAALAWIRSNADQLGLAPRSADGGEGGGGGGGEGGAPEASSEASLLRGLDLHVHLPAGAVKKDGPSAGLAVTCALLSLLSGRLARSDTAMTGEVTLRGHVLAVGGVRAKVATAQHTCTDTCSYPNTMRARTHSIFVVERHD